MTNLISVFKTLKAPPKKTVRTEKYSVKLQNIKLMYKNSSVSVCE